MRSYQSTQLNHKVLFFCLWSTLLKCIFFTSPVNAKPIEETVFVPVEVKDAFNRVHSQTLAVKLYFDDANKKPYPLALIGHGRAIKPEQRASINLNSYSGNARWLVKHGFIVAVPARIGYGETGGNDIEFTGSCNKKTIPLHTILVLFKPCL